jgi:hypothetical protein
MDTLTPEQQFAERIKAACRGANTPPEPSAMARKVSMSKQLCFKYLHGQTKMDYIPAWVIWQIADALNVSARWLFLGEGEAWRTESRQAPDLQPDRRANFADDRRKVYDRRQQH